MTIRYRAVARIIMVLVIGDSWRIPTSSFLVSRTADIHFKWASLGCAFKQVVSNSYDITDRTLILFSGFEAKMDALGHWAAVRKVHALLGDIRSFLEPWSLHFLLPSTGFLESCSICTNLLPNRINEQYSLCLRQSLVSSHLSFLS